MLSYMFTNQKNRETFNLESKREVQKVELQTEGTMKLTFLENSTLVRHKKTPWTWLQHQYQKRPAIHSKNASPVNDYPCPLKGKTEEIPQTTHVGSKTNSKILHLGVQQPANAKSNHRTPYQSFTANWQLPVLEYHSGAGYSAVEEITAPCAVNRFWGSWRVHFHDLNHLLFGDRREQ